MRRPLVIHPFFFALFPALSLVSDHIELLSINNTVVVIAIVTLVVAFLSLLLLRSLVKDRQQAGLLVSLSLLLFFSYGHVFDFVTTNFESLGVRHRHLLLAWSMLAILVMRFSLRARTDSQVYTNFLNLMGALLVLISFVHIAGYEIATRDYWQPTEEFESAIRKPDQNDVLPDIYYVILDGHASSSTLREIYDHDDAEFIDHLKEVGFFIADESRSNYAMTALSLASSLNMEHVNSPSNLLNMDQTDVQVPMQMIENNTSMRFLKSKGYRIIFLGSGFGVTQRNRHADLEVDCGYVDETLGRFIQSTLIRAVADKSHLIENDQRNRVLCTFLELAAVHRIEGPTFVFAHIAPPHWPFLFDASGNRIHLEKLDAPQEKEAYIDQLIFVDKKIEDLIDEILLRSELDPIMIIQSDHGPGLGFESDDRWQNPTRENLRERMRILNAYYLPNGGSDSFYEAITPVNTFRLIFNTYLGSHFPLLSDQSYFSTYANPYRFIDVTESVKYD